MAESSWAGVRAMFALSLALILSVACGRTGLEGDVSLLPGNSVADGASSNGHESFEGGDTSRLDDGGEESRADAGSSDVTIVGEAAVLDGNFAEAEANFPPPTNLVASTDQVTEIQLSWTAPTNAVPPEYEIFRDGSSIGVVSNVLGYDDTIVDPPSWGPPTNLVVARKTDAPGTVAMHWSAPMLQAKGEHQYVVFALYGQRRSDPSNTATGARSTTIEGYEFTRDEGATWHDAGAATSYDDPNAPEGIISATTKSSYDFGRGHTTLYVVDPVITPPGSTTYRVRVRTEVGPGPASEPAVADGAAGHIIDYQWQRSAADSDADYSDLPGVTGAIWFDDNPQPDAGRYYRVRMKTEAATGISLPVRQFVDGFKQVCAGNYHACAIRSDGKVVCWGRNAEGQAPPGPTSDTFTDISCGTWHTCALRSDGRAVCWGTIGTFSSPSTQLFKNVSAGYANTCGVQLDGSAVCWDGGTPPAKVFKSVVDGCGLLEDGHVECWGSYPAPSSTFKSISISMTCGYCGVRTDDTLECWGTNPYVSCVGDPPAGTFKSVSLGPHDGCAIRTDGTIACWGDGFQGQTPVGPSSLTYVAVAAGEGFTCAISSGGSLRCSGFGPPNPPAETFRSVSAGTHGTCGIRADGQVFCWGVNSLGDAPPHPITESASKVVVGYQASCALLSSDSTLRCWGVFHGTGTPPGSVDGVFEDLSFGFELCGIRPNGKLQCWSDLNVQEVPSGLENETFKTIGEGIGHACGVRSTDDRVVCWGDNYAGQAPPMPSTGTFLTVSGGESHTCGLRTDNKVVCWGDNGFGQAPPGPSADSFKSVSAGGSHTCGIRFDDKVVCWGSNVFGEAPPLPTTDTFIEVSAGYRHTCGVRTDGKMLCWGSNLEGAAPQP
jgi:alpha-tubulin suppressor-like RCC1 family protein